MAASDETFTESFDPTAFIESISGDILSELIQFNACSDDTFALLKVGGYDSEQIDDSFEIMDSNLTKEEQLHKLKELGSVYWYVGKIEDRLSLPISGSLKTLTRNYAQHKRQAVRKLWITSIQSGNMDNFNQLLTLQSAILVPNLLEDTKVAITYGRTEMVITLIPFFYCPPQVLINLAKFTLEQLPWPSEDSPDSLTELKTIPLGQIWFHLLTLIREQLFDTAAIADLYIAAIELNKKFVIPMIMECVDSATFYQKVAFRGCRTRNVRICEFILTSIPPSSIKTVFENGLPDVISNGKTEILTLLIPHIDSKCWQSNLIHAIDGPNGPQFESLNLLLPIFKSDSRRWLADAIFAASRQSVAVFECLLQHINQTNYLPTLTRIFCTAGDNRGPLSTQIFERLIPIMTLDVLLYQLRKISAQNDEPKMKAMVQFDSTLLRSAIEKWIQRDSDLPDTLPAICNLAVVAGANSTAFSDILIWSIEMDIPPLQKYMELRLD